MRALAKNGVRLFQTRQSIQRGVPYLLPVSSDSVALIYEHQDCAALKIAMSTVAFTSKGRSLYDASQEERRVVLSREMARLAEELRSASTENHALNSIRRKMAKVVALMGRLDEAEKILGSALTKESSQLDREFHRIRYENGLTYLAMGMLKQARGDFAGALHNSEYACQVATTFFAYCQKFYPYYGPPIIDEPYSQHALALIATSDFEGAAKVLQAISSTASKHVRLAQLAYVRAAQGDTEKAVQQLEKSIIKSPDAVALQVAVAHHNSAWLLGCDTSEGEDHLRKAMSIFESRLGTHHILNNMDFGVQEYSHYQAARL